MHDGLTAMSIERLTPPVHPLPSAPGAMAALRTTAGVTPIDDPVELMAEPPATALDAVQVASRAYEQLRRTGRELRFDASDGIIRIDVFDGTGRLVRSIPPNEVLALASREARWQA